MNTNYGLVQIVLSVCHCYELKNQFAVVKLVIEIVVRSTARYL